MPVPLTVASAAIDMSQRFDRSTTVVGSPSAGSETIVCQLTSNTDEVITEGVDLSGWVAYTVGTSGVSGRLIIRRGGIGGTIVADTGAVTRTAGQLVEQTVEGFDPSPAITGQQYTLTLTVGSGAAASTVSATRLAAVIV